MADDDESTAESQDATSSSGDENEPPPEGETGPESSSESSSEEETKPLEDNEGHSDSSAETDSSDSSSSSSDSSGSSSDKSDSSSSSSDSSEPNQSVQPPSEDEVADALTKAFRARDVPMDDDGVKVTLSSDLYHLAVRLSADFRPLSQVPDDTSNLAPGSVEGAMYMINGAVQLIETATRVTMRIVSVETSAILEVGEGNASGGAALDIIEAAAEDALAGLPSLGAR